MKGSELERREEKTDREGIEQHEREGTERSQGWEEEPGALPAQGQKPFLADHTQTRGERRQHRHITVVSIKRVDAADVNVA